MMCRPIEGRRRSVVVSSPRKGIEWTRILLRLGDNMCAHCSTYDGVQSRSSSDVEYYSRPIKSPTSRNLSLALQSDCERYVLFVCMLKQHLRRLPTCDRRGRGLCESPTICWHERRRAPRIFLRRPSSSSSLLRHGNLVSLSLIPSIAMHS
jgi:hypothetical protein